MIRNTNFNKRLKDSGMSMYALAKRAGIPYTTVNEIGNNKNDINLCSAATVSRLAAALGTVSEDIMNEIYYLDGVKGKYHGIDYVWSTDEYSQITFQYQGGDITLSTGKLYNIPGRNEHYQVIAGWMIKEYLEKLEWKQQAAQIAERLQSDER